MTCSAHALPEIPAFTSQVLKWDGVWYDIGRLSFPQSHRRKRTNLLSLSFYLSLRSGFSSSCSLVLGWHSLAYLTLHLSLSLLSLSLYSMCIYKASECCLHSVLCKLRCNYMFQLLLWSFLIWFRTAKSAASFLTLISSVKEQKFVHSVTTSFH